MHRKHQVSLAKAVLGVMNSASLIGIGVARTLKQLFGKHVIK